MGRVDIQKITASREVLRQILHKRNYNVDTYPKYSEVEVKKLFEIGGDSEQSAELCNFSVPHNDFPEWKLHILYYNFPPATPNISQKPLKTFIKDCLEANNPEDNIIIILPANIKAAAATYTNWINTINMELEKPTTSPLAQQIIASDDYSTRHLTNVRIFNINALCINILDHEYIPTHNVITNNADIKDIMDKNYISNKSQFPVILQNDPVAKILGIIPGDIVEIERMSSTSGISNFYRLCK